MVRPARRVAQRHGMKREFAPLLLTALFAAAVHAPAQEQDNQTGIPQSQTSNQSIPVDCTDPLEALSAQCAGTLNNGTSPLYPGYPSGQTGNFANQQPQNFTYTDTELLARQNALRNLTRRPWPPEPLSEFQKFVASTTGEVLPIYGAALFREVPSTFAPLDLTPVPPDYTIGPGDELRLRVWGQVNFRADVRVDRSGDVYLPQIGQVHVADIPYSALDEHLRAAIARVYKNFDLAAEVGQIRAIQVYVSGQARRPGVYTVSSLSTLVDALFSSGGPSPTGSLRHIELRRGGTVVTDFDLYSLLIRGDKTKDATLQSGDVIYIPPVGPQVAITGSVKNPAIYELRTGESLAAALEDAGGVSAVAAGARVSIERIADHADRYAMEVAYDATGLATPLADGDLVQVLSILPKYQKTVILRGNIANPGRFAWHQGMRLSDLIPDKQSLITRNYWWKRAQLGLPAPEFEPLENFPRLVQPSGPVELPRSQFLGQNTTTPGAMQGAPMTSGSTSAPDQSNPNYVGTDQTDNGQDYTNGAQVPQEMQGNMSALAAAQAAGQLPGQGAANQTNSSTLANSQQYGLLTQRQPQRPQRTTVGQVAPEIDWNYAVIERQDPDTLKTVLVPFDLGKLVLQHDASQDLELNPGDVVTVFSQDDIHVPIQEQTKFVRLDGEFVRAGVYTAKPGETLRDLVRRAGGFTPNAYLYGSEFTRESTRVVQQRRMDEYIQTLEMQMERGNLALASSAVASAQDLASGAAAQTSEQSMLARLRQMRATGRIVLELQPGSSGVDALPDITLEDGDRFVVPPIPASVNVVGAVYDQNSFLYVTTRRAGDYLHLAGGPNRDADRKDVFIIRADGSVVSRSAASGIWGDEFYRLRMDPGDTIVVPEKSFRPSALRGFLDWSQLFSQFALGAAALSVIQ